jgi:hypothetical protein
MNDAVTATRRREVVEVRVRDLTVLCRTVERVRRHRPGVAVLVNIHVAIAAEASVARFALAAADGDVPTDTLVYVGTPDGLLGLIKDIHTLRLADGAVIRPLASAADLDLLDATVEATGRESGFAIHREITNTGPAPTAVILVRRSSDSQGFSIEEAHSVEEAQ